MAPSTSALFQPLKLGASQLKHRIVMSPMTRLRADANHVPTDLIRQHYEQRTTDGGLIIVEGTLISPMAGNMPYAPGIWNKDQINAWKNVTDAVHAKGGIIYNQLWHLGRATSSTVMPNNVKPIAPSEIPIGVGEDFAGNKFETPRALATEEISTVIQEFATAAKNAMEAGFDGVEIHGASGYIVDQFIESGSNNRTDKYGGSIENRARFALEVVDAVAAAVGDERTAIRFTPFDDYQDMHDDTPYETWGYIVDQLQQNHPNLSYLHMVEPRLNLAADGNKEDTQDSLDPFRAKWKGQFIANGGYTYSLKLAHDTANTTGNLISFGRLYTSNPDLVDRIRNDYPLTKYDRSTFYGGDHTGYNDFPKYSVPQQ
ncbi:hypothetical protein BDA99DRAFT_461067 [Phascolomyces articulosus]|uniref:NADH:flavin oxidoreductase/NADH oxidase N-terminal domain-containing protein n=1 Tax=Phascolomyces articulosus TaxID=60185 RepID=A0AAD5PGC0_9FUNG|nr:hypothetical protein BDA99DRAFT_461067 [Phascolomyces articulosus]